MKVHRAAPWVSESQMGAFSAALYGTTAVAMVFINKAVLSGYHFTVLPKPSTLANIQPLGTTSAPTTRLCNYDAGYDAAACRLTVKG